MTTSEIEMSLDDRAKRELYRLTLAQFDFRTAGLVAEALLREGGWSDLGRSDLYWGLWTGLVVSYGRPFSGNRVTGNLAGRWERFEDERLDAHHRLLRNARNTLFAHNDLSRVRGVIVQPPGLGTRLARIKQARIELFGKDLSDSGIYYRLKQRPERLARICAEPDCGTPIPPQAHGRTRYCHKHKTGAARIRRHRRKTARDLAAHAGAAG